MCEVSNQSEMRYFFHSLAFFVENKKTQILNGSFILNIVFRIKIFYELIVYRIIYIKSVLHVDERQVI